VRLTRTAAFLHRPIPETVPSGERFIFDRAPWIIVGSRASHQVGLRRLVGASVGSERAAARSEPFTSRRESVQ
jgi:hypothetical protein